MEPKKKLTYASSGVDVAAGEQVVRNLQSLIKATWNQRIMPPAGGFQGFYRFDGHTALVGATDGVGTKLLVAIAARKLDTVGIDLVAMCANDIIRVGATPLMFFDYLSVGKLEPEEHYEIIKGIAEGCRRADMPLIGGETAEMPALYQPGHFDLAGFAVGSLHDREPLDGHDIVEGAYLLGIESSGLHSNGYSLARKIVFDVAGLTIEDTIPGLDQRVSDTLLTPTIIYVKPVLDILSAFPSEVQGIAHITGGGIPNKLPRALPEGMGARLNKGSWLIPPIFGYLAQQGPVSEEEMLRTFNMGIGMILVLNDRYALQETQARLFESHGLRSYTIGTVVNDPGVYYAGIDVRQHPAGTKR